MASSTTSAASEPMRSTPSPTSRRPRSKHQDSFLTFAQALDLRNEPAQSSSRASPAELSPARDDGRDLDGEPLLHRLVMMPLLSISFILSLFLVERSERARRASEHPSQPRPADSSFWSTFALRNWLDPEPYQNPDDTTWQDVDGTPSGSPPQPKKKQWFLRKKHRKVSKMQITEALEKRTTVMVALLTLTALTFAGFAWSASKVYQGLKTWLH